MWNRSKGVRDQGFKAGLVFGSRCPYPQGSDEARQWELGWADGVFSRSSGRRRTSFPLCDAHLA
jgi:hypothetical protein